MKGSVVHDRSGLFVTTEKDTIVVAQVLGGTPAARAGVKDGAKIISLYPAMGAKISFGLAKTLAERLRYTNTQLADVSIIRGTHEEPVR